MRNSKPTKSEMNPILLTKEQYLRLAKVVYLGDWMANAQRTGQEGDPHMEEYREIHDLIFSYASKFGFSENLESELERIDGDEVTEVSRLHEEYDEENFWEELPDRLGVRDFCREYSPEERKKMNDKERFLKMQECIIAWENEIMEHGLDRLEIKRR